MNIKSKPRLKIQGSKLNAKMFQLSVLGVHLKNKPQDKLSITRLFPAARQRIAKFFFGIGETIVAAIVGVSATALGTTGVMVGGIFISWAAVAMAVNAVLSIALSLAVSLATASKPSSNSIVNNGRMFNTKQTAEPVRLTYGPCKIGGNWIYADPSARQNKDFNLAISWGEGEIEGIDKDIDEKPDFTPRPSFPEALNDLMIGGIYSGSTYNRYRIKIDGANPDTFKWSDSNGDVWNATGVAISGQWQNLNNGVKIKFKYTSGHDIDSLWNFNAGDGIWLGDKLMLFYEHYSILPGNVDIGDKCIAWHTLHTGTATQGIDAGLQQREPQWVDACRNTAYSVFRLHWNDYAWNNIPEFRITLKGLKIHDTRDVNFPNDTPVFSRNPALVWLDFMMNKRYGLGIDVSRIDTASVSDCATWCDTNSYYFDGSFIDRMAFIDHLEDLLLNARLFVNRSNGIFKLRVYTDDAAVMALDDNDFEIEEGTKIEVPGIPETPNKVKCIFTNRAKSSKTDFASYPDDDLPVSVQGIERLLQIPLTGTSSYAQAKKLAKFHFLRSQYNKTFSFLCGPRAAPLEPGDMVNLSSEYLGWSNVKCRVLNISLPQDGLIPVTFGEENSAIYDQTVNPEPDLVWTSPRGDQTADIPTNLALLETGEDELTPRKIDAYVDLEWDDPGDGTGWVLEYRKVGVTKWTGIKIQANPDNSEETFTYRLGSLPCATEYEWRLRQLIGSSLSEWVNGTNFTTWSSPALDISSVTLAAGISRGRVILSWRVPDIEIRRVIVKWHIYRNQTGTAPSTDEEFDDQEIDEVSDRNRAKCSYTDKFASVRNIYYYWIQGEDAFENLSELSNAAFINVTMESPEMTLNQVTTDPSVDGTIVLKTDSLELSDMDDHTQWATDSAVPGSIILSQEIANVAEGTGALKAEIYRYPKRVCFEDGVTENFFGRVNSNKMIAQRFRAPGEFTGSSGSGAFNAGNYIANNAIWSSATKTAKIIAVFGTAAAPQIIYSLISGSDFTNGETITEFIYTGAYAASDGSCTAGTPLSDTVDIKAISLKVRKAKGSPGDITAALYSDNSGAIGTLLNTANAISASGIYGAYPSVPQDFTWGIFTATTALTRHTYYWGVFTVAADSFLNYYSFQSAHFNVDQDTATHLAIGASVASYTSYTGYDLMFRAGIAGDALNKYIYDAIGAIDISAKTYQKSYIKSANDTGDLLDHAFGESAIDEQVTDFGSLGQINTWLLVKSTISGIAVASRDAVTKIGYKITNVDKDRIFYFDIMFCNVGEPLVQIKIDGSMRIIPYDNAAQKVEILEEFIGYVVNHVTAIDFLTPDYTLQQMFHGNQTWKELQTKLSAVPPATMAVWGGASGILTVKGDGVLAPRVVLGDGQQPFYGDKNPTVVIKQAQASTGAATRRIGLMDGVPSGDPTNCIGWKYTAGGNYIAVCREGGSESTIDTGVAAADAQFDTLKFVDVGGSVEFFVNDVSKGSINTNVPDAEPMYFAMGADNTTSGRGLHIDRVQIIQDV